MKYLKIGIGVMIMCMVMSCKPQLSSAEQAARNAALDDVVKLAERDDYQIVMNTAFPLTTNALNNVLNGVLIPNGDSASRIDLQDRSDYLTLGKNNVSADLSYFGEGRISRGYGGDDTGIKFNGTPSDYEVEVDYEKGIARINYVIRDETESFDVSVELYGSRNANVNISSSHRSNIRYSGKLEQIKELAL